MITLRPRLCSFGLVLGALCVVSCGTLASRSTGDVDLPAGIAGPFQALSADEAPRGTASLIAPQSANQVIDEPSVVVFGGRRLAYMTMNNAGGISTIGRADENPMSPALSLDFEGAVDVLTPSQPWEGTSIHSPGVALLDANTLVMVYAGAGGIGLATSTDGINFMRQPAPIIASQTIAGQVEQLTEPSIAHAPDGTWYLAFQLNGNLYLATAATPNGPWQRRTNPFLIPNTTIVDAGDSGLDFDSVALGDPSLSILTTPAGRTLFMLFYTGHGSSAFSVIGAAGSYDGITFTRSPRPAYSERMNSLRAGSFEVIDMRTTLLWFGDNSSGRQYVSVAIGPAIPRVHASN